MVAERLVEGASGRVRNLVRLKNASGEGVVSRYESRYAVTVLSNLWLTGSLQSQGDHTHIGVDTKFIICPCAVEVFAEQ